MSHFNVADNDTKSVSKASSDNQYCIQINAHHSTLHDFETDPYPFSHLTIPRINKN